MIAIIDLENETARTPLTPDYDARLENELLKKARCPNGTVAIMVSWKQCLKQDGTKEHPL